MFHCQEEYSEGFLTFHLVKLDRARLNFRYLVVLASLTFVAGLCLSGILLWDHLQEQSETTALQAFEPRTQDNPEMNSFRAVFVTVPSIDVGKKIAQWFGLDQFAPSKHCKISGLVSSKLAACVNIIPQVTSIYEWEGKVEEDSELILMIKTKSQNFDELEKFVKANHPYDVPEVIAVPIEQGSQKYLDFVSKGSEFKQ